MDRPALLLLIVGVVFVAMFLVFYPWFSGCDDYAYLRLPKAVPASMPNRCRASDKSCCPSRRFRVTEKTEYG